jgi:hypothetical protein
MAAHAAAAPPLMYHGQRLATAWTSVAKQHDPVVESPHPIDQMLGGSGQIKRQLDDLHWAHHGPDWAFGSGV